MTSEILILISALSSATIGAAAALLGNWISKRSEERKHFRQLIITAAVESWKQSCENLKLTRGGITIYPVDDHIIHMMKFAELILDQEVNESNIEQKLKELNAITSKTVAYREKQNDRLHAKNAV